MNQDLVINLVPFKLTSAKVTIHVSRVPNPAIGSIGAESLGLEGEQLSWDFQPFAGSEPIEVNTDNLFPMKKIATRAIRGHLLAEGLCVSYDFIEGITVLEYQGDSKTPDIQRYKKYSVRVLAPKDQHACHRGLWCLNISYKGESEVTRKPLSAFSAAETSIKKVISGKEIKRLEDLTDAERRSSDTKPIVSRELRSALRLPTHFYRTPNKYSRFYDESTAFYSRYFMARNIGDFISVFESGFQPVSSGQIIWTTKDSNLLIFGENQTHFNPYNGLKEHGPYQSIAGQNYKFFFIFHEADKEYANKLYACLTKGLKGFPGLFRFVGIEVRLDKEKTITFSKEDPVDEIKSKLDAMVLEPDTKHIAIYISRIEKDDPDPAKTGIYYRIKNLLLEKNISSQVICRNKIDNPSFNYFLPNIGIAVLAKLGGVPWRLSRPIKHDLIVGLGAFREGQNTFLGTTVAFKNDGTFLRFDSSKVNTVGDLVVFFKSILSEVSKDQTDIKRLVIHYYKTMSKKEEKAITTALDDLGLKIPYVVLHIVEESDFVPVDLTYPGRMPTSGTCVVVRRGTYVLCNNTRYAQATPSKIDDFPFPVQIKVSRASLPELSHEDIQELIDQVYQFSRMYWISVKQKGKPVTILYSEKVAKISAAFEGNQLPKSIVATETLWFL